MDSDKRFEICNYKGEGCYQNPSYTCVLLANGIGLCTAINGFTGTIAFQIIINPSKEKLYAGRDAFGFSVKRDISKNDYSMSIGVPSSEYYSEANRNAFINSCLSTNPFPSYIGTGNTDREYFCTFLIQNNEWRIPDDYPIHF